MLRVYPLRTRFSPTARKVSLRCLPVVMACLVPFLQAQVDTTELTVNVPGLPTLQARSSAAPDVLAASLQTLLQDEGVCCAKDSALETDLQRVDPSSLKDVAEKLQGRHLLDDGRPIQVTTEYVTPGQASAGHLITMLTNKHAALMQWNGHIYILHGATYVWIYDEQTTSTDLRKLLLFDTRYSGSHRETSFTRGTDDANALQGFLFIEWSCSKLHFHPVGRLKTSF